MVNGLHQKKHWFFALILSLFLPTLSYAAPSMHLIDRLQGASVGDYIVTAIDNTYTVLIVKEKFNYQMTIEEITVPRARLKNPRIRWDGWRNWVENGAPGHTSWIMYAINNSGQMREFYTHSRKPRGDMATTDNFLSKLMSLRMVRVPKKDTKKVGPPPKQGVEDKRRYWTPMMTYEGQIVYDVEFEAWRTHWPRDGSELSGKTITVYVPKEDKRYPSYFPYWLEIQGLVGKAKIRIIDSGRELHSPRQVPRG